MSKAELDAGTVVMLLASGHRLRQGDDGIVAVKMAGYVRPDTLRQLAAEGWLAELPNGSGGRLSDAGLATLIRNMDEMGDGISRTPAQQETAPIEEKALGKGDGQ